MSMADEILTDLHARIAKTLDDLRRELANVRTGRANLHLLDGVRVDYYGTPTPLNQVATLSVPEARLIMVKPWEKNLKVMDSTAISLCMDNDLPIIVFDSTKQGNVRKVVLGEEIGTTVGRPNGRGGARD